MKTKRGKPLTGKKLERYLKKKAKRHTKRAEERKTVAPT